jgi:predicted site-specific integrase-resolvase
MLSNYVPSREARKRLGVCAATLRRWADSGKIRHLVLPGGDRVFDVDSFLNTQNRSKIIYARVSSRNQSNDLENQILYLKKRYPEHEVVSDFGSGLNFKRKGFNALLERVVQGTIGEIVVAHKDRLCRFGFDMFQQVCSFCGTNIVVCDETSCSPEQELVRDLLSIVHVFSCRLYGLRKYANKIRQDQDLPFK